MNKKIRALFIFCMMINSFQHLDACTQEDAQKLTPSEIELGRMHIQQKIKDRGWVTADGLRIKQDLAKDRNISNCCTLRTIIEIPVALLCLPCICYQVYAVNEVNALIQEEYNQLLAARGQQPAAQIVEENDTLIIEDRC